MNFLLAPPCLADKLVDWQLLVAAGGQGILQGKDILEFGPSFGIDLLMWGHGARSYTCIESDPTVHQHLQFIPLRDRGLIFDVNLTRPLGLGDRTFDVVIDFGTIDNVGSLLPYQEAARVLKPGGILLSTYANLNHLKERTSPSGDEIRRSPDELTQILVSYGMVVIARVNEFGARAGIAARKG